MGEMLEQELKLLLQTRLDRLQQHTALAIGGLLGDWKSAWRRIVRGDLPVSPRAPCAKRCRQLTGSATVKA